MIQHLKQQLFWWFREKGVEMLPGVRTGSHNRKGINILNQTRIQQNHRGRQYCSCSADEAEHKIDGGLSREGF